MIRVLMENLLSFLLAAVFFFWMYTQTELIYRIVTTPFFYIVNLAGLNLNGVDAIVTIIRGFIIFFGLIAISYLLMIKINSNIVNKKYSMMALLSGLIVCLYINWFLVFVY
ncbi:hypothetical protein [Bacillus oleivorans]|nr:hypothetical protein [Bacillus oleivorans]